MIDYGLMLIVAVDRHVAFNAPFYPVLTCWKRSDAAKWRHRRSKRDETSDATRRHTGKPRSSNRRHVA